MTRETGTAPVVVTGVGDDVRDHFLDAGGLPVRTVYRLTRRSHRRPAAAALGSDG